MDKEQATQAGKTPDNDQDGVGGVSAVDRALLVLTAFGRDDPSLTLAQLAARTGLVKSTIMRLAVSLQQFRLLIRLPNGSYGLGSENLRLGSAYQASFRLADHVVPALDRLVEATGETASFYVRHGAERLCLFRSEGPSPIRMHVQPGDTRPLDQSASAQILVHADRGTLGSLDLPLFTSGVTDPHAASLAMPVFGADREVVGVLMISGPVSRLTQRRATEAKAAILDVAARLTLASGGAPPHLHRKVNGTRKRRPSGATL